MISWSMKILTDIHTHTVASGHAFSTIMENVNVAVERGLELIAVTDHGICTTRALDTHYFGGLIQHVPKIINGVTVLRGAEANVLDEHGKLDVDEKDLKRLDIVIASCHPPASPPILSPELPLAFLPESDASFLKTYTAVINNPLVDILGHITVCKYLKHLDRVIELAKSKGKLIEINNSHFVNPRCVENVKALIGKCMAQQAKVVVSSDAHICTQVGGFDALCNYLAEINFPEKLIVNRTKEVLLEFLSTRKRS